MISSARIESRLGPLVEREGGGPDGWAERLASYHTALLEANRVHNLVSRKTAPEALERHLAPSLAALLVVQAGSTHRVLDAGSGGGLPGIPLKILRPQIRLDLVDATRKKCEFLEGAAARLGLEDVEVHWCRMEDPTPDLLGRAPFDRILARAVGRDELVSRAAGCLLGPSGEAWVFCAPEDDSGQRIWTDQDGSPLTALRRIPPA